jgi:hypothetical protein
VGRNGRGKPSSPEQGTSWRRKLMAKKAKKAAKKAPKKAMMK